MDRAAALSQLSELMGDILSEPSLVLTDATTASDVPGWDSMTNISFVVAVEQRFGIKFRTAEVEEMQKVGDMIDMIATKTNGSIR